MGFLTGEWWETSTGMCFGHGCRIQRRVHFILILAFVLGWIICLILSSALSGVASSAAEKRTAGFHPAFLALGHQLPAQALQSHPAGDAPKLTESAARAATTNLSRECSEFVTGASAVSFGGDPPSVGEDVDCFETGDGLSCADPGSSSFPLALFGLVGGVPVGFFFLFVAAGLGSMFVKNLWIAPPPPAQGQVIGASPAQGQVVAIGPPPVQ
eukprot:CAMPEP_0181475138 /NCGR_PEP_ID=MMETSP1110-20121109/41025_1 /TAXON_ID=174948 /ORGANISM="Symbiodinium sp., Strain CCMP421" /LENGTH=212 /DNA_ID=CAMNT_0023600357 /DNA_START=66 /DNA_END=704 /DNA_ORIENTATION=-